MDPIHLADPHRDIAPHAYVAITRQTKCLTCGVEAELCEIYAKTNLKSRWDRKYVTNLRPLNGSKLEYKLPIHIQLQPLQLIPFCSKCPNPSLSVEGLPYPPDETPKPITAPSWVGKTEDKPKPKLVKSKREVSTTDDLMKGLDI